MFKKLFLIGRRKGFVVFVALLIVLAVLSFYTDHVGYLWNLIKYYLYEVTISMLLLNTLAALIFYMKWTENRVKVKKKNKVLNSADQELNSRKKELEILNNIIRAVHTSNNLNEVFRTALEKSVLLDYVDLLCIYIVEKDVAVLQEQIGFPENYFDNSCVIPDSKCLTWRIIKTGQIVNHEDTQLDLEKGNTDKKLEQHSVLGIPIRDNRYSNKCMGVIYFASYNKSKFSEEECNYLASLSEFISIAISSSRKAEKLVESEEKYKTVFDNSPLGIYQFDINGNITHCNQEFSNILNLPPEEIVGQNLNIHSDKLYKKIMQKVLKGESISYEGQDDGLSNSELSVKINSLKDSKDNVVGGIAVVEDITQRKMMEEEQVKSAKHDSLSVLAGGIAHDFNNMLSGMVNSIFLAKTNDDISDETRELLDMAQETAYRAKDLTQRLLTFSRTNQPDRKLADLYHVVNDSANFALRGTNSTFEIKSSPDLDPVNIDVGQINQVVSNIIINAIQAMPDGGAIRVQLDNVTDPTFYQEGKFVRLIISDQGVGIPSELLGKIFDPYFTTKQTGSGLGLATAHSIIQKHRGFIRVESEVGKGTTFKIYIPSCESELLSTERESKIVSGSGNILVMDDEEVIRITLGKMLNRLGYGVDYACDGNEAINKYSSKMNNGSSFDAIIMDLTIPGGMGGEEAIKKLNHIDPNVRAIVSSGYSNSDVLEKYQDYGFKGIISKPYEIERVSTVVDEVLTNI